MITSLRYEDLLFDTILESSPSHGFRHDRDHIRIASCIHCDFIDLVGEIPDALHGLPEDLIRHNDRVITLDSLSEDFSSMMFQREIMHTVSTFYDISETLRNYVKDPVASQNHMKAILKLYNI